MDTEPGCVYIPRERGQRDAKDLNRAKRTSKQRSAPKKFLNASNRANQWHRSPIPTEEGTSQNGHLGEVHDDPSTTRDWGLSFRLHKGGRANSSLLIRCRDSNNHRHRELRSSLSPFGFRKGEAATFLAGGTRGREMRRKRPFVRVPRYVRKYAEL